MSRARGLSQFIQKMRERATQWWGTIVQADSSDEIDAIVLEDRVLYSATPFPLDALEVAEVSSSAIDQNVLETLASLEFHFAQMSIDTTSTQTVNPLVLDTPVAESINQESTQGPIDSNSIEKTDSMESSIGSLTEPMEPASLDTTAPLTDRDAIRHEVAFVDATLDDLDQLIGDLRAQADERVALEIVLVDQNTDGILAVGTYLSTSDHQFDAIHIVSHGNSEGFQLGSNWIDSSTLVDRFHDLQGWEVGLSEDADLFIYGCSVAQTELGQAWLNDLNTSIGVDIAASTNITGSQALGGDWILEYSVGDIDSLLISENADAMSWIGTLAFSTVDDNAATPNNVPVTVNISSNDSGSPTILDISKPSSGSATFAGSSITYTPTSGYTGSTSINYLATDGTEGLVNYFKLDGNGTDSIGSSNGTLTNGPTSTTGRFGDALTFDEVDDYVSIPDLTYSSSFSISFSFRVSDNSGTLFQYLYSHGTVQTQNSVNVYLGEAGSSFANVLRTIALDGNDATTGTEIDVNLGTLGFIDGNWHTYTLTVSSTSGATVYVDGVSRASNSTIARDGINPTGNVFLGARSDLDANRFFGGSLDSVAVYNQALSASDVAAREVNGSAVGTLNLSVGGAAAVNSMPSAQNINEDTTRIFSSGNGNQISIADSDAGGANNEITISVNSGSLTLAGTTGLTFVSGDGTSDSTMTIRGTAASINTALNGLSYNTASNYNGSATLTLATEDSSLLSLNLDANLQGHYEFSGNGNDTAPGTAQNGTLNGNATIVTDGTRGQVLSLDGSGDYLRITGTYSNPSEVTIGGWVNLTSAPTRGEFISLSDRVHIALDEPGLGVKGSIQTGASTWVDLSSGRYIAGTGWHHVMFVYSDSGNVNTLYIDGVAVASATIASSVYWTGAGDTYIGVHPSLTAYNHGLIDDARIYNRALTATEVAELASDLSRIDTDNVVVNIAAINDAPTAVSDSATAIEAGGTSNGTAGTNPTGNVLTNDTDIDSGDTKTITGVATGTVGSASGSVATAVNGTYGAINIASNGAYTYTVDNSNATVQALRTSGNTLSDVFTYTMTDSGGLTSTTQITVTIQGANDAPFDLALASPSGTNLITNGSFETNNGAANTFTYGVGVTVNGWTAIGGEGFEIWNNYNDNGPATASDGISRIEIDNGGVVNGLSQSVSTISNQTYVVSFDFSNRATEANSVVEVYWRNSLVGTITQTAVGWQTYSFIVTGSGGSDELKFMETSATNNGFGAFLDNVRLVTDQSSSITISENSANGTIVARTGSVDRDTLSADSVTYSLTNSASGRFAINATTGVITVANSSLLNFEAAASHVITVRATDAAGLTYDENFTINISNVNEAVTAVSDAATAVEASGVSNGTAGTNPAGNVLTNDTDIDSSDTKTVTGVAAGTVGSASGSVATSVTGSFGSMTIASNGAYTYTVDNSNATVQALRTSANTITDIFTYTITDSGGLTSTTQITVTIQGANDTPTAVSDTTTAVEAGGTSNGTAGTNPTGNVLTNDTDVDTGDSKTVSGVAAGTVGSASGSVATSVTGSYGSINIASNGAYTYSVDNSNATVQALRTSGNTITDIFTYTMTDTAGATSTTQITVTIQGANDAPTVSQVTGAVAAYDFENGSGSSPSVVSGAPSMTIGSGVSYNTSAGRVSGSMGLLFSNAANSATPPVAIASLPSVATSNAFSFGAWVRFDQTDTWGRIFDFGAGQQNSNLLLGREASSNNLFLQSWTSSASSTGSLSIASAISNGSWMHVAVTVNSSNLVTLFVNGTSVGSYTATSALNYSGWTNNYLGASNWAADMQFRGAMDDIAIFDKALSAGEVSALASTTTLPSVIDKDISENSANGTNVFKARSSDVDSGDGVTYSILSGNTNSTFAINSTTGQVTVGDSTQLNYETTSSYSLVIRATDTAGATTDQTVNIAVADVNEAPVSVLDTTTAVEAGGTSNGTAGTNPTGNVLTNDTDVDAGDTKTVTGVAAGTLGSASGSVASSVTGSYGSINIASNGAYTYTVDNSNATVQGLRTSGQTITDVFTYTMRDTAGLTSTTQITVTIQGANDAPTDVVATRYLSTLAPTASANNYSGVLNDLDHTTNSLVLDGVSFARGLGMHAPTSGTSTVDYSINGASTFRATIGINDYTTGTYGSVVFRVYVDGSLQYTSNTISSISAPIDLAINTAGGTTLRLEVDNAGNGIVADHAVWFNARLEGGTVGLSVAENAANGTVVGSVNRSDTDWGDNATYSLIDDSSGRFTISATTGQITVADGSLLNYEANASHTIIVRATDAGGLYYDKTLTVDLSNVNETPVAVADNATAVEAGGISNGTAGTNPTGNVLTNDTDVDSGDNKTVTGVALGTVGSASGSVATSVTGSYGSINIASNGAYTYTVDNTNATVQALRTSGQTITDVFTYTMQDTGGLTSTTQITVTIQGANDSPTAVSDSATAVEAGGVANGTSGTNPTGNVLTNDTDPDSTGNGETKTVVGILAGAQASASGNVASSVTGSYGSISIASNGAYTYTVDNNNATVQALRSSGDTITDIFTYTMSDTAGATSTTQITFTIQGNNDSPTSSGVEGSPLVYSENSGSLAITSSLVLADVDDANLSSASVQITGNYASGQDLLTFTNQNGISSSWDSMTGTLTLTGSATKANYEAALRSVGYSNSSELPSSATRTVSFTVSDGSMQSASVSRDISINSINDAPINLTAGTLFTGVNNTLTMSGANAIQVSDVDAASSSIRVTLTASHGTMTLSSTSGITFSTGDGTSDASMVLTGSLASINAALDGMQFIPTTGYTGSASISMLTEDLGNTGAGGNLSDTDVIAIQVGGVRFQEGDNGYTGTQDTYVSSAATSTAYGSATSVLVDDPSQHGLIRFDNIFGSNAGQIAYGSTITSASLSIYVTGIDSLDLVNVHRMLSSWTEGSTWNSLTSGIQANNVEAATTISYTVDAGVGGWITITGLTSSVQAWSDGATNYGWAMLGDGADNWTFHSSEFATVSLRPYLTVAFSTPQSADVDLDANNSSGISGSGFVRTWTENAGAVAIADLDATITDADSSNLQSMTISISNLQDGTAELLAANTSGTSITASYNNALGTLTLSGNDSVANYQQVLRTVTYNNTSESPTTSDRLITVQAADAYVSSNLATATIHIQGVNDAPVLDATGSMSLTSITEDDITNSGNSVASIIASAGGDRISDVDAGAVEGIAITSISSGNGTWQYSLNGGGSWSDIGSVDTISALLLRSSDHLRFVPDGNNGTTADITFRAWDQTSGAAGTKVDSSTSGGSSAFGTATEIASIVVTSVNDNPVANSDSTTAVEAGGLSNGTAGTNPSDNVLTNDTDVDSGDTKTITGVAAGIFASTNGSVAASVTGSYGSINIASNGAYTYTVDNSNATVQALRISSQTITDVFSYTLTDAGGLTSTTQITVTIQGANDAPTAVVDNAIAVEAGGSANGTAGTNPTGNVLTNDTDPDSAGNGETKTVIGVLAGTQSSAAGNVASSVTGSYGVITLAANGAYTYTVDNNNASVQALLISSQTLDDVFTYTMTDAAGVASTTQITVTIQGANDAPTAASDSATAVEAGGAANGTPGTNPTGNVLTNDTDPDSPGNGETKTVVGVLAGTQSSASGNVSSSVNGSYGSISIASNGAYTYTVDNNNATVQALRLSSQTITDVFTYTMNDAAGVASTTQITITIQGANDAPTAVVDNVSATEAGGVANGTSGSNPTGNVLTNDIDPDSVPNGETRTVTGVAVGIVGSASTNVGSSVTGSYGAITIASNGAYTYTVDNSNSAVQTLRSNSDTIDDVFTYTVVDASGVTSTTQVTVTIHGANDTPTVSSASTASILENTTTVMTVIGQDVDASTTFVYSISGGADAAKFTIDSSTGALSLISPADFENPTDIGGNNVFDVDVQISDGALSTTQSIAVTILDVSNLLYVTTADDNNDSGIATGASFDIEWLNANKGTDGLISLREAIIASNNTAGTDTIRFAISGTGVHTINVASALPSITDTTVLDATTDDSFAANSNLPAIILDGNNLNASGLTLSSTADGSTIQGFVIRDFGQNGIHILSGSDNNTIVGNFIGALTEAGSNAGITEANGVAGIRIEGSSNQIGGINASDANIFAGNGSGGGVVVFGAGTGNSILGNHIYGNGGIAIDLGGDGLTSNDGTTSAGQPNLLVDTPIISNANLVGNNLSLSGYVGSAANQTAFANSRVEFYKTTSSSSVLLGTLQTDTSGNFAGTLDVTGLGLNQSDPIIATATNPTGNTSEFSVSFEANATPTALSDADDAIEAGGLANGTAGTNPTGNVLTNDTDPNTTDTKSVSGVAAGTVGSASGAVGTSVTGNYGAIQIASNGTYTYTVDNSNSLVQALRINGQTLTDVFTYTMQDSGGLSSTTQITITVHGANDTPTAVIDSNTAIEAGGVSNATAGSNASGNVLTNDTDVDTVGNGETKAVSGVAAGVQSSTSGSVASTVTGAYGSITIASNGSYTYTIDNSNATVQALRLSSQTLDDVFSYTVTDAGGLTSTTQITITIQGSNDAPTAVIDNAIAVEAGGASNGTAGTNPTGSIFANDIDPDSVSNGETMTIIGVAAGSTPLLGSVGSSVTGTYGSIVISSGGTYSYTVDNTNVLVQALRNTSQTLQDVFTYTMVDALGLTSDTQITVTIQGANDTPTAVGESANAVEAGGYSNGTAGTNPTGNVLTNDTDPDSVGNGETKAVTGVASGVVGSASGSVASSVTGTYGSITIAANGSYTYVVDNSNSTVQSLRTSGDSLDDVFTYTMTDAGGLTSSTQITVNITGSNDAPNAQNDSGIAVEAGGVSNATPGSDPTGNVLSNDSDIDNGDTRNVVGVAAGSQASASGQVASSVAGAYGTITIASDGSYSYSVDNSNSSVQALRTAADTLDDVFTYTIQDAVGLSSTAYVTITIQGQNDVPVAVNDSAIAVEAGGVSNGTAGTNPTGNVLTNDTDVDSGDSKTVVGVVAGASSSPIGSVASIVTGMYGSLVLQSDGSYTYTVDNTNSSVQALRTSGQTLSEVFTYSIQDSAGSASIATLTLTIQGSNDAPVAVGNTANALEASGVANNISGTDPTGNVLTNDTDVDAGDSKAVSGVSAGVQVSTSGNVGSSVAGTYGSLVINSNGTYTYTVDNNNATVEALNAGQSVTETFSYTVVDTAGATSTSTLVVTINGADDLPFAVVDFNTSVEAGGLNNANAGTDPTGNVFTNDTTPNGSTLSGVVAGVQATATGSVNTPVLGDYGTLTIDSAGNYSYVLNNSLPAVEALRVSGDHLFDLFTYTFTDTLGYTSTTQLTITIDGSNDAPIGTDDTSISVEAGGTTNGTAGSNATGNVVSNDIDVDSGDTKEVVGVVAGGAASASGNVGASVTGAFGSILIASDGTFSYSVNNSLPAVQALRTASDTLTDVFTYTMEDMSGAATTATLTITIQGQNDNPIGVADTNTAIEAGGVLNGTAGSNPSGNVLSNDTDVDTGDSKTVTGVVAGSSGTPNTNAGSTVSGSYGSVQINSDGTYTYVIDNTNSAVQALRTSAQTLLDVFTYTVTDTAGDTSSTQLTITIQGANDTPDLVDDTNIAVEAGGVTNGTAGSSPSGNVLTNDSDRDAGETLTVTGVTSGVTGSSSTGVGSNISGSYGAIQIQSNGSYSYVVDNSNSVVQGLRTSGDSIQDVFSYTVQDTSGATSTAHVTITITGQNDAPVGVADQGNATEAGGLSNATAGSNGSGNVLTNDTDVDTGDSQAVVGVVVGVNNTPTNGSVASTVAGIYGSIAIAADGTYTYSVDESNSSVQSLRLFSDTIQDVFSYTMADAGGLQSTAQVTITIHGQNDAPIGVVDQVTAIESSGYANVTAGLNPTGNVLTNDTDVDSGDSKTIIGIAAGVQSSVSGSVGSTITGLYGQLTLAAGGSYSYVVDNNSAAVQALRNSSETLQDVFTYTMQDSAGVTSTTQITVTIEGRNDSPTDLISGTLSVNENAANSTSIGFVNPTDIDTTDTFTYSLTNNASGRFAINSTTGEITVADGSQLDRELAASHSVIVRVTDAGGLYFEKSFSITLDDIDEFDVGSVTDSSPVTNSVNENASVGTLVGITATASDLDANFNTITYSLANNDGGRFAIDANTGVVTVAGAIDRETDGATRTITVRATSADASFTDQTFTIAIGDVDEFNTGAISDSDVTSDSVNENAAIGTGVGIQASASDLDSTNNTISYSLVNDDGGRFAINGTTGIVTVADVIDREVDGPTRTITVRSTSADGSFADQSFSIAIIDVNEFAVSNPVDSNSSTNTVLESSSTGTIVGITAFAQDNDATNSSVTYALLDSAGGRFQIQATNGIVAVANGSLLDFENSSSHQIIIQATSSDGSVAQSTLVIQIGDVAEAPIGNADNYTTTYIDTIQVPTSGVLANDTDPDNNVLSTILVSGPANGSIVFNSDGSFIYVPEVGFVGTVQFVYRAFDGANLSGDTVVTIEIALPNNLNGSGQGSTSGGSSSGTDSGPTSDSGNGSSSSSTDSSPTGPNSSSSTPVAGYADSQVASQAGDAAGSTSEQSPLQFVVDMGLNEPTNRSSNIDMALVLNASSTNEFVVLSHHTDADDDQDTGANRSGQNRRASGVDSSSTRYSSNSQSKTAFNDDPESYSVDNVVVSTVLSTGVVIWVVQGAQILATLLSVAPAYLQLDPLSVLPKSNEEELLDASCEEEKLFDR